MAGNGIGQIMAQDPYLAYQPSFAYTLPVQLVVSGITLTLLCVLLIHIVFTTQYHYPLAPLNYSLQLSSVIVVTISVLTKIITMLQFCSNKADFWPYDLDYIAVTIPPPYWSTAKYAAWLLLQAFDNGLANITHIQFLTLLYPSRIEARLILFSLGPIAVASSSLVFTALAPSQKIIDIGDSIRNVLNSTLLLSFSIALFIWGFLVNRRRAWRLDGGTAVFGCAALCLAAVTTSCNFVAVVEDGIDWLQHLLFAAILWQTWVGWWWWVGSGMGIGEVEDLMERAERKKRKAVKRAVRERAAAARPRQRSRSSSLKDSAQVVAAFTSGVASILRTRSSTLVRRHTNRSGDGSDGHNEAEDGFQDGVPAAIELNELRGPSTPPRRIVEFSSPPGPQLQPSTVSETSSSSATLSLHVPKTLGQLLTLPTTWLQIRLRRVRHAHEDAAKAQAIARAEKREKLLNLQHEPGSQGLGSRSDRLAGLGRERRAAVERAVIQGDELGWGLGRFGLREHEDGARRIQEAQENLKAERLLSSSASVAEGPEEGPGRSSIDVAPVSPSGGAAQISSLDRTERERTTHPPRAVEEDWEDIGPSTSGSSTSHDGRIVGGGGAGDPGARQSQLTRRSQGSGWSWWGPLSDWRLADRSQF